MLIAFCRKLSNHRNPWLLQHDDTALRVMSPPLLRLLLIQTGGVLTYTLSLSSVCAGGAGGKGTWGKLVEVYDEDGHTRDSKDPNYNSEDEEVGGVECVCALVRSC